jgi:hypothetical protein
MTTSINAGLAYGIDDGTMAVGFADNDWYYGTFGSISSNVLGNFSIVSFYQAYEPGGNYFWFEIYCPDGIDPTASFIDSITCTGTTISSSNSSYLWEYSGPNIASWLWYTTPFSIVNGNSYNIAIQYSNMSSADISALPTNLQMVYINRLNARAQSSFSLTNTSHASTWNSSLTFTHTATFANADAARYFFNSGGQFRIHCEHAPNSNYEDTVFHNLASNIGYVYLSSPTSYGYAVIGGVSFNGVTRTYGNGTYTISAGSGFYALTTANTTLFTQSSTSQTGSTISIIGKVNDALNPSVVTLYTVWTQVPSGNIVSSGSNTSLGVGYPITTYIANTWGTVTVVGSVTGS